jgi:hypothetical protein
MSTPPNIEDHALQDTITRVGSFINSYNSLRDEREALVAETKKNVFEEMMYALGPLLTSMGLAIRITKTTGEIMIEKETKKLAESDKPVTPNEKIAGEGISGHDRDRNAG